MKDTQKEEKVSTKRGIVITKEIAISFVVGILFGALITSCIYCTCKRSHFPNAQENRTVELKDHNRQDAPKKFDRQNKNQRKIQKTETNETANDNSTSNN